MNLSWQPQTALTPSINAQVIQSIKLLQFSHDELNAFISEQCEQNPLIDTRNLQGKASANITAAKPTLPKAHGRSPVGGGVGASAGDYRDLQDYVAADVSLRDHLHAQIGGSLTTTMERLIAIELIESIDDDGYLRRPLHSIAGSLDVSEELVEDVLLYVQTMDPPGVAARSLGECLLLQLRESGSLTKPFKQLLDHLPLLANHEYRQLSNLCGVGVENILAMAEHIRRLDPRPGRRFDNTPALPAIADVTVTLAKDGSITTSLNNAALPRVLIDREYQSTLSKQCTTGAEAKFVADCLKDAYWLVRNIDQRAKTVLKVATEIMARQREFLVHGPEHLKPLNLKQVADSVGVHQSTVCRAISNKYAMTPHGLRELRFFFANSISTVDGDDAVSSDTVRRRIEQLIGNETLEAVLSDDAIVKELRGEGVDIARRTVAKYREAMHIPSSLQRRRQKQATQHMRTTPSIQKVQGAMLNG